MFLRLGLMNRLRLDRARPLGQVLRCAAEANQVGAQNLVSGKFICTDAEGAGWEQLDGRLEWLYA